MKSNCPGAGNIRIPELLIKLCPSCGGEIEIFSNELQSQCESCGFIAYKDLSSCVRWCKYAEECIGPENYQRLTRNPQIPQ
jgi:hypothetical protein